MTYKLCEDGAEALRLLAVAQRYSMQALRDDSKFVPDEAGIYGWWFVQSPPGVPTDECLAMDGASLLYVGIAPRAPSASGSISHRTLRDRLRNHCRGPIAVSTLRRTLAHLLSAELGFVGSRSPAGKSLIGAQAETRLTEWMAQNASVGWALLTEPWVAEDSLIKQGPRLPLNLKGSSDPFAVQLGALRRSLKA